MIHIISVKETIHYDFVCELKELFKKHEVKSIKGGFVGFSESVEGDFSVIGCEIESFK